jgi:hypothetical protein
MRNDLYVASHSLVSIVSVAVTIMLIWILVTMILRCIGVRWIYSPKNDTWVWVHGSSRTDGLGGIDAIYPLRGAVVAGAMPYPRWGAAGVVDLQGRLWMMGGQVTNAAGIHYYNNDLSIDTHSCARVC